MTDLPERDTLTTMLTPAVDQALEAIPEGENRDKMEDTILLLAFAEAYHITKLTVFRDPRACNQRVWYQKWQYIPEVAHALKLCIAQARRVKRQAMAQQMAQYADEYALEVARGKVLAIKGLQLTALNREDRGSDRTDASKTLLIIEDETMATRFGIVSARGLPIEITGQPEQVVKLDFSNVDTEILRRLADAEESDATTD